MDDKGAALYNEYKGGNDEAIEKLIDEYYDGLVVYLSGITGDMFCSEDLAQEVFEKLAIKKPGFKGRSSFKTWLYTIGGNHARDYLRKMKKRSFLPIEEGAERDSCEDLEQSYIKNEEYMALYDGLRLLKKEYRQALWLAYFEGMPIKEIAKIMNRSESSVTSLISRGKFALRKSITDKREERDGDERS